MGPDAPAPPRAEIIHPPNALRAKVGARFAVADPVAVARAEAALKALSGEFAGWMAEETARLEAARAGLHAEDGSAAAWDAVQHCAHDLKGLGATYGFPLATRVCASLCRLLDDPAARALTPRALVDAHVEAVRAIVRDDARDPAHPVAAAMCAALEERTAEALARRTPGSGDVGGR